MRLKLTHIPDAETERLLDRWSQIERYLPGPVTRRGGDALRLAFAENFSSEGQGQWMPLTKRTEDEREALGYPRKHPILVREGDLMESVINPAHPLHFEQMSDDGDGRMVLSLGSLDERYEVLHFGDGDMANPIIGGTIPARPMMVLWEHQEAGVEMALVWAVEEALGIR